MSEFSPADIVPRTAPDPDALVALDQMIGQTVTVRDFEMTESGLRAVETEAVLFSVNGNRKPPPPDPAA